MCIRDRVGTLRLTGGEPLLHRRLEELIAALQPLRQRSVDDPRGRLQEIALTSNGVLLTAARARALREAGLDRITLSLDGSDGTSVARMAGLSGGAAAGEAVLAKVLAAASLTAQPAATTQRTPISISSREML